jgi:hypothetical protein
MLSIREAENSRGTKKKKKKIMTTMSWCARWKKNKKKTRIWLEVNVDESIMEMHVVVL